MKAAVLEALDRIVVRETPDPVLPDEESLILKVHACAVCGSDIRILHHGNPRVTPPQIIGHEVAGQVVAVGVRSRSGGGRRGAGRTRGRCGLAGPVSLIRATLESFQHIDFRAQ